jgi:carbonic anhydrase
MQPALSTSAKVRLAGLAVLLLASAATIWAGLRNRPVPETTPATPAEALAELKAGNERFARSQRSRSTNTRADADRRKELVKGQKPIVALLGCADSRVIPEVVFDQEFGRVFDIRNAGNVVDEDVLASLEYAVEHLQVPLLVVLGHKGCGAIQAVNEAGDRPLSHHLKALQQHMAELAPEVRQAGGDEPAEFLVRLAAHNAQQQARRLLKDSDVLRDAVGAKTVAVAVGLYDMETGKVGWLELDPGAK